MRENIPHGTVIARKMEENATYREFYSIERRNVPSHATMSRFFRKLTRGKLPIPFFLPSHEQWNDNNSLFHELGYFL
ncbi:MAG: transposase [Candidatus Hodarchaeales archaeon]